MFLWSGNMITDPSSPVTLFRRSWRITRSFRSRFRRGLPGSTARTERDNKEIQNWLIPVWDKGLSDAELEREVDEGMLMLNYIKPRMVLGYQTSAQVYFTKESMVEDADRDWLLDQLQQIKDRLWPMSGERLQRKAVRMWLQQMGFYEEWEEIPEDAATGETVNRSPDEDVAF